MKNYDVIVVGAGPAGSGAAMALARCDINCAIFEQRKTPGQPVCCGEAVSLASLKTAGVYSESYIDRKVEGFRIFSPNGKFFTVASPGCVINRDKFDALLYDIALKSGARGFTGHRVTDIKRTAEGFEVTTNEGVYGCKFIVGADGPRSTVDSILFGNPVEMVEAMQYNLPKNGFPYSSPGYIDFYYDNLSKYYFWIFEKSTTVNVGGVVSDKAALHAFIKKHFNRDVPEQAAFCRGVIPASGIKKKIFDNHAYLAGDAAGLANPVSFAGIYTAVLSGKYCGYSIAGYFRNRKKKALKSYDRIIRSKPYAKKDLVGIGKESFSMPEEILNFTGDYFDGRSYRTKDVVKFLKMAAKQPSVLKYILPLARNRHLLRYNVNNLW
ncbi:MAG: NAD(P)/FAD-dependent oxidoreductase [Spirochaetia bacterium]|nr:NAD(P)/FAD-dependent oxidoreductase [Spirochaetia bacterium]